MNSYKQLPLPLPQRIVLGEMRAWRKRLVQLGTLGINVRVSEFESLPGWRTVAVSYYPRLKRDKFLLVRP